MTGNMQNTLGETIKNATKWSVVTEFATKLMSPLTNAILARILVPEAFGIVATLTLVTTFAEIFTDAGFQKYIVQHEFEDEEDLKLSTNVAFWTNLLMSVTLWIGIAFFSKKIAEALGIPEDGVAIAVIGLQIPMLAFSSIQMARYRRDFAYKDLFAARMVIALIPLVVTIPCALIFRSYWALIAGTLIRDLVNAMVLTARSKWKPLWQFEIEKLREMVSFCMWTVIENISIWISTNAGIMIVSGLLGTFYVGMYKTVNTTVTGYMGIVPAMTMSVLFSALSRYQNDEANYRNIFYRFQRMVALIVIPLGWGCFVYRDLVTWVLLGGQWMESADYLGLLFLTRAMEIIFSYYNSEAFRSKGRPKLSVLAQCMFFVVEIPMLYSGAQNGFKMLAIASCASSYILILFTNIISQRALGMRFMSALKNVLPVLIATIIMSIAGSYMRTIFDNILWELFTVLLCVLIYAGVLLLLPSGRRLLAEIPILRKLFHSA